MLIVGRVSGWDMILVSGFRLMLDWDKAVWCLHSCLIYIYEWCGSRVNVRVLGKGLEPLSANGGRFEINQLLFADDTAPVAHSEELCRPLISWVAAKAVRWSGNPKVARSRLIQCSKSCDLQPALHCAIRGAQGVLPSVGWGVRPVNWIYRLWRHRP